MKKTFVLDTNVLLHDPNAIFGFDDNNLVIPIYVLEEVDKFKKEMSELGRNARAVARILDEVRQSGSLTEGVELSSGGLLRVCLTHNNLDNKCNLDSSTDSKIIATALQCHQEDDGCTAIFVTKDVNLRIRAAALGLLVEDFDTERTDISELYTGISEIEVDTESIDRFYREHCLVLPDPYYLPNQYVVLKDISKPTHTALGRVDVDGQEVGPLYKPKNGIWGIRSRNREQNYAIDALMDDTIKLVTLVGKAGTGKTLLAIAAGLEKVTEESVYKRLLISRPVFPLGRDIGFLPGDIEEKMTPWMQPIFDNVEFLMGLTGAERGKGRGYHELIDLGLLEIEPLTYIRGRSIPQQYLVVDEAQNLTPHEVKTIVSRAGENTKIVLTGDPYQIDNPYVDATNNGLVHTVNCVKSERLAAHITMCKGERSELAELATNVL